MNKRIMKIGVSLCRNKQKAFNITSTSSFSEPKHNRSVLSINKEDEEDKKEEERRMKHTMYNLTSWDKTHLNKPPNTPHLNKSHFDLDNNISSLLKENKIKSIKRIAYIPSLTTNNKASISQLTQPTPIIKQSSLINGIINQGILININDQSQEQKETEVKKKKKEMILMMEIKKAHQRIKDKKEEMAKLARANNELTQQKKQINSNYDKAIFKLSLMVPINSRKNTETIVKLILRMKCHQNSFNESIQKEVMKLSKEAKTALDENSRMRSDIEESLNTLEEEMRVLREVHERLKQEQIEYYVEVLSRGKDTRSKGLMWVVIRLLSLKALVDEAMFPFYLKANQRKYLIQIGRLHYDLNRYHWKIKRIKQKFNEVYQEPIDNGKLNERKTDFLKTNSRFIYNSEENRTKRCIKKLKWAMLTNNNSSTPNVLTDSHKAFSDLKNSYYPYFSTLKDLREKIEATTKEINRLMSNQLNQFKEESRKSLIVSSIETAKSRLLYAALFGSTIL